LSIQSGAVRMMENFRDLLLLALQAGAALIVISFALEATLKDMLYLFREPAILARSLLSMTAAMPLIAVAFALLLPMDSVARLPLMALSLSPVPPLMPRKQQALGGKVPYTIGLFAVTATLSIVLVPLFVWLIGAFFGAEVYIPPAKIVRIVAVTVLAPLATGIAFRWALPNFATRISDILGLIAIVILIIGAVPLLIAQRSAIFSVTGDGTILILAVFAIIGLAVGHVLGGPDAEDRTVLALATSARHPGIALAILAATKTDVGRASAVVLLYLIVVALVSMPYIAWRKSARGAAGQKTVNIHSRAKSLRD
jgi:bile acid:Na+ symporter, BASS family